MHEIFLEISKHNSAIYKKNDISWPSGGFIPEMQRCFNSQKSINEITMVTYHCIGWYRKKHLTKILHPFMIKILRRIEVEGNFLSAIKGIYKKSTTIITLTGERVGVLPLRSGTMSECPHWPPQCSARSPRPYNRRGRNGVQEQNGRMKIVPIFRWRDGLHRKPERIYRKKPNPNS